MNIGSSNPLGNPLAPSASGKGSFPMNISAFSKPSSDFNPLNPLGGGKVSVKTVQNVNPLGGVISGSSSNPLGNNNPLGSNPLGSSPAVTE